MAFSSHKILALVVAGLVATVLVVTMKHSASTKTTIAASLPTTPTDAASGDTNAEVLRELTAEYQKVVKENQQYQQKIIALSQGKPSSPISNSEELNKLQQAQTKSQQQIAQLQAQLSSIQESATQNTHTDADADSYQTTANIGQSPTAGMITTVTDMGAAQQASNNVAMNTSLSSSSSSSQALTPSSDKSTDSNQSSPPSNKIPYYTIPALSNLANTVLMTSLIGEVPQGSTFAQPPFPFLALVGKHELLAANGVYLPSHLAGMKIAGYSVGVGSFIQGIACTRAYITQVLFVFDDGTSFTVQGKHTSGNNIDPDDTLGYLSDPYGNPCIKGKYITNADRVIAMLTGSGFADGVAKGLTEAQTNTMTGFDGTTTVFNGSIGKYAAGNGVSVGVEDAANYMQERLKGTFDVVYVPASTNGVPTHVIANFTKTIPIDLNQQGRKIYYDQYSSRSLALRHGLD